MPRHSLPLMSQINITTGIHCHNKGSVSLHETKATKKNKMDPNGKKETSVSQIFYTPKVQSASGNTPLQFLVSYSNLNYCIKKQKVNLKKKRTKQKELKSKTSNSSCEPPSEIWPSVAHPSFISNSESASQESVCENP